MLCLFIFLSTLLPTVVYSCAATATPSTPSPVIACQTCANVERLPSDIGTNQMLTQTVGTNGDGCRTITVTCANPTDGTQVVMFWTEQGADRGTSQGTTSVSRTLVCDANANLILTEPTTGGVGIVDQVECVSP